MSVVGSMKKSLYDTDVLIRSQMQEDPQMEIKAKLAEFLLALIQAFLRTGYYTPDHPESQKAKVGLYEDFQNLFVQKDELTFLVREDPGGKNILVEGVLPEIQDLISLMIAGMAQMYVPRFVEYLEQKDLLSLTLKSTMTRTEFTNFVDLMGEPKFIDTQRKKDKERFSKTLQDRGISNISYIYNEELLAQERNIHWRSRIALTRLKKDFSIVPLYSTLDRGELKKVRRQIIHDLFRSFQNAEAVYSVLINTDLAVTKDFSESEIDHEIVDCLSDKVLFQVSQTLLNETLRHGGAVPAQGKSSTLAMEFVSTLNQRQLKGREAILDEYAKLKLIPFDQLPKAKQQEIRQAKLTDKFLQNSTNFLAQLEKIQDREKYHSIAQFLAIIVPELIHRDEYEKVLQIITHFERQSYKTDHRSTRARQILEKIGGVNILDILRGRFLTGDQERCSAIAPVFLRLGLKSVPHLLSILKESKDFSIRKNVCEIFAQMDPGYIDHILKDVSKERLPAGHTIRTCGPWEKWGVTSGSNP